LLRWILIPRVEELLNVMEGAPDSTVTPPVPRAMVVPLDVVTNGAVKVLLKVIDRAEPVIDGKLAVVASKMTSVSISGTPAVQLLLLDQLVLTAPVQVVVVCAKPVAAAANHSAIAASARSDRPTLTWRRLGQRRNSDGKRHRMEWEAMEVT